MCDFKLVENTSSFNENFVENYNEDTDAGYFLEVDVQYPEKFHDLHNVWPFLSENGKRKIWETCGQLTWKKKEYVMYIRNLNQTLYHGLVLRKVHRIITFNKKNSTKIAHWYGSRAKEESKKRLRKIFLKLMNYVVFGKTMENEARRNYLVTESNYHTRKFFWKIY